MVLLQQDLPHVLETYQYVMRRYRQWFDPIASQGAYVISIWQSLRARLYVGRNSVTERSRKPEQTRANTDDYSITTRNAISTQ